MNHSELTYESFVEKDCDKPRIGWKLVELKEMCKILGISTTGKNKTTLCEEIKDKLSSAQGTASDSTHGSASGTASDSASDSASDTDNITSAFGALNISQNSLGKLPHEMIEKIILNKVIFNGCALQTGV